MCCRQQTIKENMRKMPEMIANYRKAMYELRAKTREKKQHSEEMKYHIAIGKKQEGPAWQMFKDQKR